MGMPSFSKMAVATVAALGLTAAATGSASAVTWQDAPATVVRPGDDAMTCRQMADEGAALSADMGESGPGLLGRVSGIARAGATLLVPAAGLAVAGVDALTSPGKAKREAEADTRRDRWNYLNGLYAGRSCDENAETTGPTSSPAPAPAPTAAAPSVVPIGSQTAPKPNIIPTTFPH